MASSLKDETMGMTIIPITTPALRALKISMFGKMFCSWGETHVSAKYPYTTVGMPASTSRAGLITRLILSGAYSARKIAIASPTGIATRSASPATRSVPPTRGRTP